MASLAPLGAKRDPLLKHALDLLHGHLARSAFIEGSVRGASSERHVPNPQTFEEIAFPAAARTQLCVVSREEHLPGRASCASGAAHCGPVCEAFADGGSTSRNPYPACRLTRKTHPPRPGASRPSARHQRAPRRHPEDQPRRCQTEMKRAAARPRSRWRRCPPRWQALLASPMPRSRCAPSRRAAPRSERVQRPAAPGAPLSRDAPGRTARASPEEGPNASSPAWCAKHRDAASASSERYQEDGEDLFLPAVEAAATLDGDLVRVEVVPPACRAARKPGSSKSSSGGARSPSAGLRRARRSKDPFVTPRPIPRWGTWSRSAASRPRARTARHGEGADHRGRQGGAHPAAGPGWSRLPRETATDPARSRCCGPPTPRGFSPMSFPLATLQEAERVAASEILARR